MTEQATDSTPEQIDDAASIVDTLLDLDGLLSADVRRARGTAWLYKRADLEARLDVLARELDEAEAREQATSERAVGERSAAEIDAEREQVRREYRKSGEAITVEQMSADDWDAFKLKHKDALATAMVVFDLPADVANELIAKSMLTQTPTTTEQVAAMRQVFGWPQISEIAARAWEVNQHSGVSVPK